MRNARGGHRLWHRGRRLCAAVDCPSRPMHSPHRRRPADQRSGRPRDSLGQWKAGPRLGKGDCTNREGADVQSAKHALGMNTIRIEGERPAHLILCLEKLRRQARGSWPGWPASKGRGRSGWLWALCRRAGLRRSGRWARLPGRWPRPRCPATRKSGSAGR